MTGANLFINDDIHRHSPRRYEPINGTKLSPQIISVEYLKLGYRFKLVDLVKKTMRNMTYYIYSQRGFVLTLSLGTWAISSSCTLPSYWIRVPPLTSERVLSVTSITNSQLSSFSKWFKMAIKKDWRSAKNNRYRPIVGTIPIPPPPLPIYKKGGRGERGEVRGREGRGERRTGGEEDEGEGRGGGEGWGGKGGEGWGGRGWGVTNLCLQWHLNYQCLKERWLLFLVSWTPRANHTSLTKYKCHRGQEGTIYIKHTKKKKNSWHK